MIALTVVAILSGMALPSFVSLIARYRMSTAHNEFVQDLVFARAEAARRSLPVSVCASTNGTSCQGTTWTGGRLVFVDPTSSGTPTTANLLRYTQAGGGVSMMTPSFAGTIIRYDNTGKANVSGTIVSCKSGLKAINLTLSPTGRVGTVKTSSVCT